SSPRKGTTYRDAGVDIGAGRRAVDLIRGKVSSTFTPEVVGGIGGFGGLFAPDISGIESPVLVSSTDGVGTKVLIAQKLGIHSTVGFDLVAHSANDVSTSGARPLFFLDYIVIEKVVEETIDELVSGMVDACREVGCALIGGEIAEHPKHLESGSYDLAGFCVGIADRSKLITGAGVKEGDVVIGIASSGLHCNGYTLARKVLLEDMGLKLDDRPMELTSTLGEELLKPMFVYSGVAMDLQKEAPVHGLAHITGGDIQENLARVIPDGLQALIDSSSWEVPPIFGLIESLGRVQKDEMFRTFNMGVGMVVVTGESGANHAIDVIREHGHRAIEMGAIVPASVDGKDGRAVVIS
ncbi:MAG: phosphoribosylformylglycinamidine cyclo-ligase, partial [Acidimicrobiia bacterium]